MVNQAGQGIKKALNDNIGAMSVIKGIGVSYLITLPIFAILALILTYTDFPEKHISTAVIVTTLISLLIAGSTATTNLKNRGWLNGAVVGIIYMIILYLLSSVALRSFSIDRHVITMLITGIITGAVGGIIGINRKHSTHAKRGKIS